MEGVNLRRHRIASLAAHLLLPLLLLLSPSAPRAVALSLPASALAPRGGLFSKLLLPSSSPAEPPPLSVAPAGKEDVSLIWYTATDLRVTDHEGLVAASSGKRAVPLFVFDEEMMRSDGPRMAALTNLAVRDLQSSLRDRLGIDLVCRVGKADEEIARVAREIGASVVFAHSSPLTNQREPVERARKVLQDVGVELRTWTASLRPGLTLPPMVEGRLGDSGSASAARGLWDYPTYKSTVAERPPCETFHPIPQRESFCPTLAISSEVIPSVETCAQMAMAGSSEAAAKSFRSEHAPFGFESLMREPFGEKWALDTLDKYVSLGEGALGRSLFGEEERSRSESLDSAAIRRIISSRGYPGLAPGEVFSRAFSCALSLGCISPRRVWAARNWEVSTNPMTVQRPITQWEKEVTSWREWHETLAEANLARIQTSCSQGVEDEDGVKIGYWRWNGWQCRYFEGGNTEDANAPVLVMVHGFGASADQFRRCFRELGKENKYKLFAVDLVGFGHSIKPPITYTQYLWSDFVRDFGLQFIRRPFYLAGNSIGGYSVMGVAADSADLCKGVVLLNSAGRLLGREEYQSEIEKQGGRTVADLTLAGDLDKYNAPPNVFLSMISAGLFYYLKSRINSTCKRVYPTRPDRVDDGLADNILRDCLDPGALGIFNAGAKLPASRSANEMLQKFGGPVLVAQGLLDPLNNAPARAQQFREASDKVKVVELDAGHCPHHEYAEEVCAAMADFIESVESQVPESGPQSAARSPQEVASMVQ